MDVLEHNGETYQRQGDSWINIKTSIKPPLVIIRELNLKWSAMPRSGSPAPVKSTGARPKKHPGRDFMGLKEYDFSTDTTGTHWRREETLKGLLTHRLSTATGRNFESRAISYRPQVLIGEPPRFDKANVGGFNLRKAKFNFRLDEKKARYSLYIEKSDKPMDATWEWPIFLEALQKPEIVSYLEGLMENLGLHFHIELTEKEKKVSYREFAVHHEGSLVFLEEAEQSPITWNELFITLKEIRDTDWCDVNLGCVMSKEEAIDRGAEIATPVVDLYLALLRLYDACKRKE